MTDVFYFSVGCMVLGRLREKRGVLCLIAEETA